MTLRTYSVRNIFSTAPNGTTRPAMCSINGVLKFDHPQESPHCVYNEYVALRIAQSLNIPVADGCLVMTGDGHAYVSLGLATPGMALPDVIPSRRERVRDQYPDEVAALVAFDLLIGNRDRGESLKAALGIPQIRLFAGYDHSFSLLNVEEDPWQSIARLASEDYIVEFHPFFGQVTAHLYEEWLDRIGSIPDYVFHEHCRFGRPFRGVSEEMQEALANALCLRKGHLYELYERNAFHVTRSA